MVINKQPSRLAWLTLLFSCLLASTACKVCAEDGVTFTEEKIADGQLRLKITHPEYGLEIVPALNGKGVLTGSRAGELISLDSWGISLFQECFNEKEIETAPMTIPYEYTVEKNDGKKLVLSLQATLTRENAGADLAGVLLKRTITCDALCSFITVVVELRNSTQEARYASVGIQQRFALDKYGNDTTFIPTTRNILEVSKNGQIARYYAKGIDWEYEPVEGWLGVIDQGNARGLVFVMDYNTLEGIYTSTRNVNGVRGWQMDLGALPPQTAASTRYLVVPLKGFKGVSFASEQLIADTRVVPQKEKVLVNQTLQALQPMNDILLENTILNVATNEMRSLPPYNCGNLQVGQTINRQTLDNHPFIAPIVVRTKVKEKNSACVYEVMEEGQFYTQPIPFAPFTPQYRRVAPERKQSERMADAMPTTKQEKMISRKILLFYGFYTKYYNFEKALKGWDVKVSDARPDRAEYLPPASEISQYALIILSNVTADSLPSSVIRRLEHYVQRGGGLLVLGGPFSYGEGNYNEKGLEKMLPVEGAAFDLKWHNMGLAFRKCMEHPITNNLDLTANPMSLWHHQVKVKKNAEVLMAAGDYDPLLIVHKFGRGRVACFAGTPLGKPISGQLPFWEWSGWVPLLASTVNWIASGL